MVWNAGAASGTQQTNANAPYAGDGPQPLPWFMGAPGQNPAILQAQQGLQAQFPAAAQQGAIPLGPVNAPMPMPPPNQGFGVAQPVPNAVAIGGAMGPQQAAASAQILPPIPGGLQYPMNDGSGGSRTLVPFDMGNGKFHVMDIIRGNRAPMPAGDAGYGPLADVPDPRTVLNNDLNAAGSKAVAPAQAQGIAAQIGLGAGGPLSALAPLPPLQGNNAQMDAAKILGKYAPQSQGQVDQDRRVQLAKMDNDTKIQLGGLQALAAHNSAKSSFVGGMLQKGDQTPEQLATAVKAYDALNSTEKEALQKTLFPNGMPGATPGPAQGGPPTPGPNLPPPKTPEETLKENALANRKKTVMDNASAFNNGKLTKVDPRSIMDSIATDTRLQNPAAIQDLFKSAVESGGVTPEAFKQAVLLGLAKAARNSGSDLTKPQPLGDTGLTLHQPSSLTNQNLLINGPGVQGNVEAGRPWFSSLPGFFSGQHNFLPSWSGTSQAENRARAIQHGHMLNAIRDYYTQGQ